MEPDGQRHAALLALRESKVALALAPRTRWQDLYGRLLAPLELPARAVSPEEDALNMALRLSSEVFGREASPLPTRWTYGPSARHAIDRVAATTPEQAPFLRFERALPGDELLAPRVHTYEVFRASLIGAIQPNPRVTAGILWLSVAALRQLVGGLALAELLALPEVTADYAESVLPPADALVYLPSEYGERLLVRVAAKYGEHALSAIPSANE